MKKNFNLDNKVVLITGAGGILGFCFSKKLLENGASIIVSDINKKLLKVRYKELLSKYEHKILICKCDVTKPLEIDKMIKESTNRFESIDVLVNNAASKSKNLKSFFAKFEDYKLNQWKEIMEVNINGMFNVAQKVGTFMVKQNTGGSIIQIASIQGVIAPDHRIYKGSKYLGVEINNPAVYSVSKAGVISLSKYLSTYWAKNKIRVNSISPGGVRSGQNDVFVRKYSNRVPMGRMAKAEEIANGVLFLASNDSSYVNGHNLVIDGGLTVW